MMERMKKVFALLLCLGLLSGCICDAAAGDDDPLSKFMIHHGSRDSKKIAITVDDCYKTATEWIEADVELCKQYATSEDVSFVNGVLRAYLRAGEGSCSTSE